jgi:hypothetical protein
MAVLVTELIDKVQSERFRIATPESMQHGLRPRELQEYIFHYQVEIALREMLKVNGNKKCYSRFMTDRRRQRLLSTMKVRFGDSIQQQRVIDGASDDMLLIQDAAYRFLTQELDKLGKKLTPKASNKPVVVGGYWVN